MPRLALISDTHGNLPKIEPVDLALICGDVCPVHDHDVYFQYSWLDTNFRSWLESLNVEKIVGIAGNHDFYFQDETAKDSLELPWTYLQDSGTTYDGLSIWGSPWVPNLPGWAFYENEVLLHQRWEKIPDDTNILITHGPPNKIQDKTCERFGRVHAGSPSLAKRVDEVLPMIHAFGHIHEARGSIVGGDGIKDTAFINCSYVDENYLTYPDGVVYLDL